MQLVYKINLRKQLIIHKNIKQKKYWYNLRRRINKHIRVARNIAHYVVQPENKKRKLTSKSVSHLGNIPSTISNQIIRKYQKNKKCKKISNVNLIIPANASNKYPSIIHNKEKNKLIIKPLKLELKWKSPIEYDKICQIELNNKFVYINLSVKDVKVENKNYGNFCGVDLNLKPSLATIGNPLTENNKFIGYNVPQNRKKYKAIRKRFQKQKRPQKIKEMGDKEHRYMKDQNFKITKEIIDFADKEKTNISIEDLTGIRKNKGSKEFNGFLNSWSFYDLKIKIENKSQLKGIHLISIDPKYTSQTCSKCQKINKTKTKKYKCSSCGYKEHRDVNASYNIANKGKQKYVQKKS